MLGIALAIIGVVLIAAFMLLRDYEADRSPVPKGAPPLPQFPTDWGAFARNHGLTPAPPKNASVVVLRLPAPPRSRAGSTRRDAGSR